MMKKHNITGLGDDIKHELLAEVNGLQLSENLSGREFTLALEWFGNGVMGYITVSMISNVIATGTTGLSTMMIGLANVSSGLAIIGSGVSIFFTFQNAKKKRDYFRDKASELEKRYYELNDIERKLDQVRNNR